MKKIWIVFMLLSLLLSGCQSFADDTYLVIEEHSEQPTSPSETAPQEPESICNRSQLRWAVLSCISNWAENSTLQIEDYEDDLASDLDEIVRYATQEYPIGAYAVDFIDAELDGNEAKGTIALSIVFRRSAAEIKSIVTINTTSAALRRIEQALRSCQSALTFRIREYDEVDFSSAIRDYCLQNLHIVPAIPEFSADVYPPMGETRILELHFTYPDSKDALQMNLDSVNTILLSAKSYVQAGQSEMEKVELLARFLTTRFDYRISFKSPSMPAYDLLCRGLAHSLSFAAVFRYECEQVGIDCRLVSGMRNEQPHYWNIVCIDGVYYHVDLMRDLGQAELRLLTTHELIEEGYIWKQDAYPEVSEESTDLTEPTEPTETTGHFPEPTESTEGSSTEPTGTTQPTEDPTTEEPSTEPTETTQPIEEPTTEEPTAETTEPTEASTAEPTESTEETTSEPTQTTEPTGSTEETMPPEPTAGEP